MKIVIDVDENIYHRLVNGFANEDDAYLIEQLFKDGKVLPNRHGDLIDRDAARKEFDEVCLSRAGSLLNYIPAVIEADKDWGGGEGE